MSVRIGEKRLTCEDVCRVAKDGEKVVLTQAALDRISHCREFVERKVSENTVMYGITTGIGELSETVLTPEQTENFQRFLVYSHAAGYGDPLPIPDARSAVLSRISVLSQGHSGIRPVVVDRGNVLTQRQRITRMTRDAEQTEPVRRRSGRGVVQPETFGPVTAHAAETLRIAATVGQGVVAGFGVTQQAVVRHLQVQAVKRT